MKKVIVALLLIGSIVGCDHQPAQETKSVEPTTLTSNGTAPHEKKILRWTKKEVLEKLGDPTHTGESFEAYLPLGFRSSTPETVYAIFSKPGAEQGVYIENFPVDKHFRVTLSQVDHHLKKIDEIAVKEYLNDTRNEQDIIHKLPIRMAVFLPEKKDALYSLVTELIEENGEVSDSMLSLICVPGDEINAVLTTDKKVYNLNETMTLKLTNYGPTWLSFGVMYLLEKEENGVWVPVNGDWVWTLEGYNATPENDFTQVIKLDQFGPGKYRITKHVDVTEGDYGTALTDTFEIKEQIRS